MTERERIEELLLHEVVPGVTTLGELAALLDRVPWLGDDGVIVVSVVSGKIPVQWTFDDTVFALRLPEGGLAYFRVRGKLTGAALVETLRGHGDDDSRGRVVEERSVVREASR